MDNTWSRLHIDIILNYQVYVPWTLSNSFKQKRNIAWVDKLSIVLIGAFVLGLMNHRLIIVPD